MKDINLNNNKDISDVENFSNEDKNDGFLSNDISKKFDNLTNLEDNMRKLNQVLETSIKSSYRTRYEYNLNDYKKNFETNNYNQINNFDDNGKLIEDYNGDKNDDFSKNIVEDFEDDDNIILSKRFYAEKNTNKNKKINNTNKNNFVDKSDNFQNTINLRTKNNNFADFEEIEQIVPKQTLIDNNNNDFLNRKTHDKSKGQSRSNYPNMNYNSNTFSNSAYNKNDENNENFDRKNDNKLSNFNQKRSSDIKTNINRKMRSPINNFAELNHQFESFNLDDVLKTADNLGKNKQSIEVNNKRVEISNKIYDMNKLKKINSVDTTHNNTFNKAYVKNDIYDNTHFNSYSNTNYTNNSKKGDDEFDYLKNLLMKTQMEIQNFNEEFDDDVNSHKIIRNNSLNKVFNSSNNLKENNYYSDSTKETIPRKQPKPQKPSI